MVYRPPKFKPNETVFVTCDPTDDMIFRTALISGVVKLVAFRNPKNPERQNGWYYYIGDEEEYYWHHENEVQHFNDIYNG